MRLSQEDSKRCSLAIFDSCHLHNGGIVGIDTVRGKKQDEQPAEHEIESDHHTIADQDLQHTVTEVVDERIKISSKKATQEQQSEEIREQFGKAIPIIIHDLEYPWYMMEATKEANPNGEADTFFFAMKKLGIIGGRL